MAEHEIVWFGKKAGHENLPESLLYTLKIEQHLTRKNRKQLQGYIFQICRG